MKIMEYHIPLWNLHENDLHRTYIFPSFEDAMAFMQAATPLITKGNHHPEWSNVYNRVVVRLTTHDAGNTVTEKDHALAALLDGVYEKLQA
jgi:4a-hydroxytetrahydrobiopterin dehydratase